MSIDLKALFTSFREDVGLLEQETISSIEKSPMKGLKKDEIIKKVGIAATDEVYRKFKACVEKVPLILKAMSEKVTLTQDDCDEMKDCLDTLGKIREIAFSVFKIKGHDASTWKIVKLLNWFTSLITGVRHVYIEGGVFSQKVLNNRVEELARRISKKPEAPSPL